MLDTMVSAGSDTPLYALACVRCKRQKVKCDRALPACVNCTRSSHDCVYPEAARKPGPKPGTSKRRAHSPAAAASSYPDGTRILAAGFKTPRVQLASPPASERSEAPSVPPVLNNCAMTTLIHPVPDAQPGSPISSVANYAMKDPANPGNFIQAMDSMGIEASELLKLVDLYFDNVTIFSLFHKPTFHHKISSITSPLQVKALLMSMLAVSRRFVDASSSMPFCAAHSTEEILDEACKLNRQCIDECGDSVAPLCVLQAEVIVTFLLLVQGVRSRAYRMTGECVSLAYDLDLQVEDAAEDAGFAFLRQPAPVSQDSVAREERRRLWWAIWETDIFAANMKRLPALINPDVNKTKLPVSDQDWFDGRATKSCFLSIDPTARWQNLSDSGNHSLKAWQLLMYSYKHDSVILATSPSVLGHQYGFKGSISAATEDPIHGAGAREIRDMLENSLSCTLMAMPRELAFSDRYLSFKNDIITTSGVSQRQLDAARYNIHAMANLTMFMLFRREVYSNAAEKKSTTGPNAKSAPKPGNLDSTTQRAWERYLHAAAAISSLARNSAPDHYKYTNPWLANVLWYSAASQVITVLFGPASVNKQLISSNFELLRSTLIQFTDFWGLPELLIQNLDTLGHRVDRMIDREFERRDHPAPPSKTDGHNAATMSEFNEVVGVASKRDGSEPSRPDSPPQQPVHPAASSQQDSVPQDDLSMTTTDDFINNVMNNTSFDNFDFDVNDFFFDPFAMQVPV